MFFRKGLFSAGVVLLLATNVLAQGSTAKTALVYGPTVFTLHEGGPDTSTFTFARPQIVYGPFTLLVSHRDVTGISIDFNGAPLFGSQAFDSKPLHAVVPLAEKNTLKVALTGLPGSSVTILITGYEYPFASSYVNLPVAPASVTASAVPSEIDWRTKGAVTPVKNQGQCGSSWAFAATGAIEGATAVSGHGLPSLTEQQLIDCSMAFGNHGCNGGTAPDSYRYTIDKGGLTSESAYPYTARDGSCRAAGKTVAATISRYVLVERTEQALTDRVALQPVSAVVRVGHAFRNYKGGLFDLRPCNASDAPDFQDVLIVGYTPTYWIIKNSWGTSWGSSGYVYLARGRNTCGILDYASAPIH